MFPKSFGLLGLLCSHVLSQYGSSCAFLVPTSTLSTQNDSKMFTAVFSTSSEIQQLEQQDPTPLPIKSLKRKIMDGAKVAPMLLTTPIYAISFAFMGPAFMWNFSKHVYRRTNPLNYILHDVYFHQTLRHFQFHFQKGQVVGGGGEGEGRRKNGHSAQSIASQSWRHPTNRRALAYRLHPLFAGLALIVSGIITFGNPGVPNKSLLTATAFSSQQQLLTANLVLTVLSAIQCMQLKNGMLGTESNRTWVRAQAQLSIGFSFLALTFSSGLLGQIMKHLHFSLLLTAGALERLYVLCILSQVRAEDKKSFLKYYSPQHRIATLASIPLGLGIILLRSSFGAI